MSELREEIVTTPEELAVCCNYLASCPQLGFDTEFVGEDTYHPSLCLVQVATMERLFLIDPLTTGVLDAFWQLLLDPNRVIVVHAGREEVRLCRLCTGQVPANLYDLQLAAGLTGLPYPLGHGALVGQVLGVHLSKGETLTEWRNRPLTPSQIRYAFDDVRYLLPVWKKLSTKLEKLTRTAWASEEFLRLSVAAAPDEPETERWRKLRGLGSLDRRRLAIVRELFDWREGVATRNNRPVRTILRDDLIVEIARRNPTRERDLQVVRGLGHRDLTAILEAVARAQGLPPEQLPVAMDREQDLPQVAWVTNILNAVLGDLCVRHRLAANLVASTSDVRLLVRARLTGTELPEESVLTRGWRATHILPDLLAVLDGKRSVRIANLRSETPFAIGEPQWDEEDRDDR
jgi:ribonuclease D